MGMGRGRKRSAPNSSCIRGWRTKDQRHPAVFTYDRLVGTLHHEQSNLVVISSKQSKSAPETNRMEVLVPKETRKRKRKRKRWSCPQCTVSMSIQILCKRKVRDW